MSNKLEATFLKPDPDECIKKAKNCVIRTLDAKFESHHIAADDLYILSFSRVFEDWRALITTDKTLTYADEKLYFDVTYDAEAKFTHVDRYGIESSDSISDHFIKLAL